MILRRAKKRTKLSLEKQKNPTSHVQGGAKKNISGFYQATGKKKRAIARPKKGPNGAQKEQTPEQKKICA